MNNKDNIVRWSIISIFVGLYALVSIVSTIHVIDFFRLSNPDWLAITLAIAFEIGAAASLGAIVILNKTSRWLVWSLFITITLMQMMGNMYYAYTHITEYTAWTELFGINEEEPIYQKRILSIISGAILPIVALGFIKSLVDYIRPSSEKPYSSDDLSDDMDLWDNTLMDGLDDLEEEEIEESLENWVENEIDPINGPESDEDVKNAKDIERKIATAIASNAELKEKLTEEIKKIEDEDKYTKTSDSVAEINTERRRFGGL
jgi:hypothetical protein